MTKILKPKSINYYKRLIEHNSKNDEEKEGSSTSTKVLLVMIPVLLIVGIAAVYWMFSRSINNFKSMTDANNRYINGAEVGQQKNEIDMAYEYIAALNNYTSMVAATHDAVAALPEADEEVLRAILNASNGNVTIANMTYADGSISFMASALDYHEAPDYVERLRQTGYFTEVTYVGFTTGYEDIKDFNVQCVLKADR